MKAFLQIIGVALVVLGGQGLVRILFDHNNFGLLSWLSHSFVVVLIVNIFLIVMGAILAGWASKKQS